MVNFPLHIICDTLTVHSVPLGLCYPPLMHYRACAKTRTAKLLDIGLFLFGVAASIFTSIQTLKLILGR